MTQRLQARERVAHTRVAREPRIDGQRIAALHAVLPASAAPSSFAAAVSHVKSGSATNDAPNTARIRSSSCSRRARGSARGRLRHASAALWSTRAWLSLSNPRRLLQQRAARGASSPAARPDGEGEPEIAELQQSPRARRRARRGARLHERVSAVARRCSALSALVTRAFEFGEIDVPPVGALGGGSGPPASAARASPAAPRGARLLQHVEQRQLAGTRDRSGAHAECAGAPAREAAVPWRRA